MIGLVIGFLTGLLAGLGVGGGTLLLLWLTAVQGLPQRQAQGVNLLFFLAASLPAVLRHGKSGLIDRRIALQAGLTGMLSAGCSAALCAGLSEGLLRKGFGLLCILMGVRALKSAKKGG